MPLKAAMPKKVSQVLEDEISKRTYFRLLEAIVGGTVLKAYYGKEDPEHNITDWSDKVARRIRRLW
jgi:hypothetical protein